MLSALHRAVLPAAWRRRLLATIETGIGRVYALLVERGRIDELFRYRRVEGWMESLDEDDGRGITRPEEVPVHG